MKQSRVQRAWLFWLALPAPVRLMPWIVLLVVLGTCAGCSHLSDPHFSAEILQQDEVSCAANPRALPGCIFGVVLFVRWRWQ